jgi:hypothetical protein
LSFKKLSVALVAALITGALVMASMATAGGGLAITKVTIHGDNGDFQGKIISDKGRCLGNRKVVVYKQKGDRQKPSEDKKIGSDISERDGDHGDWSIGNSGFKHGKFYAKAKKNDFCRGDFSKTITL